MKSKKNGVMIGILTFSRVGSSLLCGLITDRSGDLLSRLQKNLSLKADCWQSVFNESSNVRMVEIASDFHHAN